MANSDSVSQSTFKAKKTYKHNKKFLPVIITKDFFANNGSSVFYVEVTNEILLLDLPKLGLEAVDYNLSLMLEKELPIGSIVYLGEL